MARRHGVSKDALDRHRRRHMGAADRATPVAASGVAIDRTTLASQGPAQDRRALFVQEYLVDLNATQAAIRAGYSPHTARQQASDLLTNLNVRAAIQAGMSERAERVRLTAYDIYRETKALVQARVDHYEVDGETGELRAKADAPPDAMAAVSSVKRRRHERQYKDGTIERWWEVEFRLWSKPETLRLASQQTRLIGGEEAPGTPIVVQVLGAGAVLTPLREVPIGP